MANTFSLDVVKVLKCWSSNITSTALVISLFALSLVGCRQSAPSPVTLSYLRLGWSQPDELPTAETWSQQFTRRTGIRLRPLPVPENTLDQLDLSRKLLQSGAAEPDVLGLDFVWSGVLADDLLDLRPYFKDEIPKLSPQLVSSYEVDGRMVAIPYEVQVGVLEYRTDLLRKYGYDHAPKTWNELESMAERIQTGERAKGKKAFWGYVWQGADAEALTCNAIEWQIAEGGGQIIENDHTISVNNPAAIRSWQRARHWIGWISPRSVVAFRELDSMNVFDSGQAAFNRVWGGATITRTALSRELHWRSTMPFGKTGYTSIPGGPGGWAGALGGSGLAVSRHSAHPQEAVELVRFLIDRQIQRHRADDENPPAPDEAAHEPPISNMPHDSSKFGQQDSGVVSRPSSLTGRRYEQVTKAYISAVHSVLAGDKSAPQAAAELQQQLVQITGFRARPPH
jgi:trehalose/maltose transport system substrate-binding protein